MFIKVPFLIEGMLQGLIGSFISIFILFSADLMAGYFFSNLISLGIFNVLYILLNLFVGLTMGFIGSSRVISKYL
jgi:cell division protein FtsX